jgi:hypothetical protein
MTITEYAVRSVALRKDIAASQPLIGYSIEVLRHAALMALALMFLDLGPSTAFNGTPWARARFIVGFGLLMGAVQVWRLRRSALRHGAASHAS